MPVMIAPSAISAGRSALLELKQIDAVRVRRADKKDMFVVEVFAARADPTLATSEVIGTGSQPRRPIVSIERTLLEFVQLRDKIYDIAHEAHRGEPCELCTKVLEMSVFGANPDGFIVGLLGGKRMKRTVMKFMVELLRLIVRRICADPRGCYSGQTLIPQAVHAFVFTSTSYTT